MRRPSLRDSSLLLFLLAAVACSTPGSRSLNAPAVPRRHLPRVEDMDAEHYALELSIDAASRTIDGRCRMRLVAVRDEVEGVDLDLEGLETISVRDGVGRDLAHEHAGDELRVTFVDPLEEGQVIELVVEYTGAPVSGLWFVGDLSAPADHVFTQGECEASRAWFPCLDYPADRATSELRVEMPGDWIAVAAGDRVDQGELDGGRRYEHWRMASPHPTYLTTLVAGDFTVLTDDWEGLPLTYLAPEVYAEWMPPAFDETPEILAFLSEMTGLRYPYTKYAQTCVEEFPFGGMENITATTLTCETLTDERGRRDRTSTSLVVHEAAHQWFGNLLTCREWSHIWLNEGFATYCSELWVEHTEGEEAFRLAMRRIQDHYTSQDVGENRRPTVSDVYRDPMDLFFGGQTYQGGAARLHLLRGVLGDEAFFAGVRRYVADHGNSGVRTDDLRAAFESASGRDLETFFDEWLYSAGYPLARVSTEWSDGVLRVTVEQVQGEDGRAPRVFHLPAELEVRTGDRSRIVRFEWNDRRQTITVDAPEEPRWVRLDPRGWIPMRVDQSRPVSEWADIAEHSDFGTARVEALGVLGKAIYEQTDEAARGRLVRLVADRLADDPREEVRRAAAQALAAARGPLQRGALVAAAQGDESSDVRAAALISLTSWGRDPGLAELADAAFQEGYSWDVMTAAARLYTTAAPRLAFDWVTARASIPSPHGRLQEDLADVIGALDDERVMPWMLARAADETQPTRARQGAVRVLGKIGEGSQETRTLMLQLLDTRHFHLRQDVIRAVRALNETSALGKLSALYRESADPRERRLIEDVARDLSN